MQRRFHEFVRRVLPAITVLVLAASASTAMAAEAAEAEPSVFGNLGPAISVIVIFLVLLAVLGKWAWKPVVSQLEMREKSIADTIADAQERNSEAEALLAQYRARLDAAAAESKELLATARREAVEAREHVLAAAQQEVQKASESARAEIERAKKEALSELYDKTAQLATEVAGRVIRRNLTSDDRKRLMNDSLEEIRLRASR